MNELAPDNIGKVITDHPFRAKTDEPWGLCRFVYRKGVHKGQRCSLSEAAHSDTIVAYHFDAPYRCASCITKGVTPCTHEPEVQDGNTD